MKTYRPFRRSYWHKRRPASGRWWLAQSHFPRGPVEAKEKSCSLAEAQPIPRGKQI